MTNFRIDKKDKYKSGFTVPDNYFEEFQHKITVHLNENKKVIPLKIQIKIYWYLAAAAIFVICLSIPIVNNQNNKPMVLSEIAIENYIISQTNISNDDLLNVLNIDDIQNIIIDENIDEKTVEDALLQDNNLEQYLIK